MILFKKFNKKIIMFNNKCKIKLTRNNKIFNRINFNKQIN